MTKGYITLSRSIFDEALFSNEPFTRREAFIWLVANAAWSPMMVQVRNGRATELVALDRGQLTYSRSFLKEKWRWSSEKKVRTFLDMLQRWHKIDLQTGHLQTVITICNYGTSDNLKTVEGPANRPAMGQQRAGNGPEEENIINIRNNTTRLPASPEGFDEWYGLYPRKQAKQDARRAFTKVMSAGLVALPVLMEKTKAFAATWDVEPKERRKFIPYPASWLNAGRYDDEADGPAEAAPAFRDASSFTDVDWQKRLAHFEKNGDASWGQHWGPKPGQPNCLVPSHLLLTPVAGGAKCQGVSPAAISAGGER